METLVAINAALGGLFAFAAIHFAVTWWYSRNEQVHLYFAIQSGIYVGACYVIVSYFQSSTVPEAQSSLNWIVTFGAIVHGVVLHFYVLLGNRRDRAFRWVVSGVMLFLAVLSQLIPMRGTVLDLQPAPLPWGGAGLLPVLTPPGAPLALLYLVVFAIHGYGLFIAGTIWKRDRAGAILIAAASMTILAGATVGVLVDFAKLRAPYAGAFPHAIFVVVMSLYLAREYAARGARLAAKRRQLDLSLAETQQALADLEVEHRLLEESEAARIRAVEAVVHSQRKEIASQIAAGVAHDFSNVLSVISVWSGFLLDGDLPPERIEKARNALEDAQEQGHALSKQLMSLARTESRLVKRIPFERPIRMAAQTLAAALPRKIEFDCVPPGPVEIEVDENEIQQVIYNLVLNARDAMPDGGTIHVSCGVETLSNAIEVVGGTIEAGRWATLSVQDSGPGIDQSIRDRVFELFFTTKGEQGGTGLGLATVLRIAKANGGGVTLEDSGKNGSTFKLYFPVYESAASATAAENHHVSETPDEKPAGFQASSV